MTLLALHICSTVHLLRLLLLLLLSTRFCFLCGPARQGDIRSAIAIALTLMCVFINTKTTKQSECHDTFCLWPVFLVLLNLMNKCHGEEEPFSCSAWQGTEGASEIFLLCLFVLPFFFCYSSSCSMLQIRMNDEKVCVVCGSYTTTVFV